MSTSVHCERFSAQGRITETGVEFTVNRVGNQVYIHIKGNGPAKSLLMSVRDWCQLDSAVTEGPRP